MKKILAIVVLGCLGLSACTDPAAEIKPRKSNAPSIETSGGNAGGDPTINPPPPPGT